METTPTNEEQQTTIAPPAERLAYSALFDAAEIFLAAMMEEDFSHWGPLYVRWETGLLDALGFGLDLSRCAVNGTVDDLLYISPRTRRAIRSH